MHPTRTAPVPYMFYEAHTRIFGRPPPSFPRLFTNPQRTKNLKKPRQAKLIRNLVVLADLFFSSFNPCIQLGLTPALFKLSEAHTCIFGRQPLTFQMLFTYPQRTKNQRKNLTKPRPAKLIKNLVVLVDPQDFSSMHAPNSCRPLSSSGFSEHTLVFLGGQPPIFPGAVHKSAKNEKPEEKAQETETGQAD